MIAKWLVLRLAPSTKHYLLGTQPMRPSMHLYGAGTSCKSKWVALMQGRSQ